MWCKADSQMPTMPNKHAALQFEWHWQHPRDSKKLKNEIALEPKFGRGSGVKSKLRIMSALISQPPFSSQALGVHFPYENTSKLLDKTYATPNTWGPLDEWQLLKQVSASHRDDIAEEDSHQMTTTGGCRHCRVLLSGRCWTCHACGACSHLSCMAVSSLKVEGASVCQLVPTSGTCEECKLTTSWGNIVLGTNRLP